MYCKCQKCGKEFNMIDGGYVGPEDLSSTECTPFMEMAEWCTECYGKEKKKQKESNNDRD